MRACVLALLVSLAAGCATHRSPDTGSPFVQRSRTSYADGATFDAPKAAGDSSSVGAQAKPDPNAIASDQSIPKTPTPKSSDGPTLEASNAGLGAALAELKRLPTADAYVAVGSEYHRLGIFDSAEKNFQQALRLNSKSPAAHEGLARVWRDWGLPQYGLTDAYRAASLAPRSPSVQNTLGTLLFALGEPEAAQTRFEKALALDPSAVYALNNLCYVSFMLGDGGPAVARCTQALTLDPESTTTRNNLALVYAAQGHADAAALEFAKASDVPAASFNVGIAHMARHEYKDAAVSFAVACSATPQVQGACAWAKEARKMAGQS